MSGCSVMQVFSGMFGIVKANAVLLRIAMNNSIISNASNNEGAIMKSKTENQSGNLRDCFKPFQMKCINSRGEASGKVADVLLAQIRQHPLNNNVAPFNFVSVIEECRK